MLDATRPQRLRSLYGEREQTKTEQLEKTPGVRNVESRLQMQLGVGDAETAREGRTERRRTMIHKEELKQECHQTAGRVATLQGVV